MTISSLRLPHPAPLCRLACFAFLLAAPVRLFSQNPVEDDLFGHVVALEGKSAAERGAYVEQTLKSYGTGYMTAPFHTVFIGRGDTLPVSGTNIVAHFGHGFRRIVVGAHYDIFPGSPGANDNASGVAVALELVHRLAALDWHCGIDVCFFDQEEVDQVGSAQYVKRFAGPAGFVTMIDVDVVGRGEELYVGPRDENGGPPVLKAFREAAATIGVPLVEGWEYPPSDFLSFINADLPAVGMAIVPKGDGERLSAFTRNQGIADPNDAPTILSIIHTTADRSMLIEPEALKRAFDILSTVLRTLDRQE